MTRRQWRADTGRIALFVSVNIHTTHYCCIRGVVLSPPICRGKQQWNYNECVRPALGQGWCHVYVPLCGVCLRSAISGARQELQSLVRGTASCTVMQCRDRVIAPSPCSGAGSGVVVPTLMTRHTLPTIAEVVLSAAIVNVMQLLKLRSCGSTKYHAYHQPPHQVTPAAANKKFFFPNLIEWRTPPLH